MLQLILLAVLTQPRTIEHYTLVYRFKDETTADAMRAVGVNPVTAAARVLVFRRDRKFRPAARDLLW